MKTFRDDLMRCFNGSMSYQPTEQTLRELEDDLQAMDSITQWVYVVMLVRPDSDLL